MRYSINYRDDNGARNPCPHRGPALHWGKIFVLNGGGNGDRDKSPSLDEDGANICPDLVFVSLLKEMVLSSPMFPVPSWRKITILISVH